ncbi:g3054 [Coccomyxa elongata]
MRGHLLQAGVKYCSARRILTKASAMEGKKVLITGATDGIGKHTAARLAKLGATVLLHGRNQHKADEAAKEIQKKIGGQGHVHAYAADMAVLGQVRELASRVQKDHPSIDILINNAGVFPERKILTEDGFEQTWAVNVLAPFLLTSLLVKSVKERIINVSSISASSRIDFDNLNQEKGFSAHNAYSLSKLAMMMFNTELATRLSPPPTANCLDPGTVNTKMLLQGWGPCGIDIEDANHELYLATSPDVANTTGQYFVSDRPRRMPSIVQDISARQRLWNILEEQSGETFPE